MIDTLNKGHTDRRFINNANLTFPFITLKVQDIHYLFSKSIPFTFFAILIFEVPKWSICFSHPKVTTPEISKFCFLGMPELCMLIFCIWIRRPQSVRPVNDFV